jgi:glycogen synthase
VGDVAKMSERAITLFRSPELHDCMRRAAAEHALTFSTDRIVPRYEELYEEVLR